MTPCADAGDTATTAAKQRVNGRMKRGDIRDPRGV
jgi:hypothetical protein